VAVSCHRWRGSAAIYFDRTSNASNDSGSAPIVNEHTLSIGLRPFTKFEFPTVVSDEAVLNFVLNSFITTQFDHRHPLTAGRKISPSAWSKSPTLIGSAMFGSSMQDD
jgi:hypothetical protein